MKKLEIIADELFNKIRGRYPKITLGDSDSTIVNDPKTARFFEFEVAPNRKVNVTLDGESLTMLYNNTLFDQSETTQRKGWFDFLKELRQFARKRMLTFDTRDITKSNLDKRDFAYLSQEKSGDKQMSESKMYGTSQTSYQNIGNARIIVKHSQPIGETGNRNSKIHAIYIESGNGEKFKYPFKHMNGARAAANHVSEGGNLYDDVGKHIVSLSEELAKLRKFKTYMNRSNVMAEGLGGYLDVVNDRIDTVKETVAKLQKENYYKSFVENFTPATTKDVPEDVQSDWIDQLTIKQFNEELKGVFPYIYKLVSEANAVKELTPEDLLGEDEEDYNAKKKALQDIQMDPNTSKDPELKKELARRKAELEKTKESVDLDDIDLAFEQMMGQFGDHVCEECGNPSWKVAVESEKQKGVDGKVCWKGYKRMGTKMKGGKRVDNCVKMEADTENLPKSGNYVLQTPGLVVEPAGDSIWDKENTVPEKINIDRIELGITNEGGDSFISSLEVFHDAGTWEMYTDSAIPDQIAKAAGLPAGSIDFSEQGMQDEEFMHFDIDDEATAMFAKNPKVKANTEEGNAYANAVRQAKKDGKKKGDEIDGPDGEKIKLEKDEKTPLGEFILSYFDRETGQFPKGETAVLTMVEKDYGDEYVKPASKFIESIYKTFEAYSQNTDDINLLANAVMDEGASDSVNMAKLKQAVGGEEALVTTLHASAVQRNMDDDEFIDAASRMLNMPPQEIQAIIDNSMNSVDSKAKETEELERIRDLAGL